MENQENTQEISSGTKKTNEFITSDFIDCLLDKLRSGYLLNFFEDNQKNLTKWGLYGLYLSAILSLILAIIMPILFGVDWDVSFGIGGGFIFFCLIAHYLAVKFLPNVDAILKSTPSTMGSNAFIDSLALLFLIVGICSLIGGIGFAISKESFDVFLFGLGGFILCEYLVSLCLKPDLLNITIEKDTSAAQELLGLTSFFIKAALKLVPIIFGSSVVFGVLNLFSIPFNDFKYIHEINAEVLRVSYIYIGTLSPIIGYLIFLFYYFVIDIILAILSLNKSDR